MKEFTDKDPKKVSESNLQPALRRRSTKVDGVEADLLIVSFKSIYINIYNVYVINLKSKRVVFVK